MKNKMIIPEAAAPIRLYLKNTRDTEIRYAAEIKIDAAAQNAAVLPSNNGYQNKAVK